MYNAGDKDPTLVLYIGIVYLQLGNIEEAIIWFARATRTPSPISSISVIMIYNDSPFGNTLTSNAFE